MKKIILTAIILYSYVSTIYTQEYSTVFGKFTQHEFDMTEYKNDKDAEAVVLFDFGRAALRENKDGNFSLFFNRKTKIKILKQAGISYADFIIPLYEDGGKCEELSVVSAITYNYENSILSKTPLDLKNVFQERANKNVVLKKFSMPDVRTGSIIEIEYDVISPFLFNLTDWYFQRRIPTVYSLFTLLANPYYVYQYIVKGITNFDEYSRTVLSEEISFHGQKYEEVEYKMGMKNLPAFKDEEFITSPDDYILGMNFQLAKIFYLNGSSKEIMTTWAKMCNDFLNEEAFGKYINAAEKGTKKIVSLLDLNQKNTNQKTAIITQYIKNNFNWNGIVTKFAREKASNVIKNKTGNSAELNLLLLGMLKNAGLDAKPVMLSTRDHGIINTAYPFQQFFNYVIVMVQDGEKQIFLDATEPMLTYNELPSRCINVKGLLVYKNSEQWVNIIQDELCMTEKAFNIKYNNDLSTIVSDVSYTSYSYDAFFYRKKYYGTEQGLKEYFTGKEVQIPGSIKVNNYKEVDKPFSFSFQTETPSVKIDNKLFVSPFLNLAPSSNIFRQEKRTLPVDILYRQGEIYTAQIDIPAGYKIESLPKPVNFNRNIAIVNYVAEQKDNVINITARYELTKSVYEAKDYVVLKAVYGEIVRIFNEKIVFVEME